MGSSDRSACDPVHALLDNTSPHPHTGRVDNLRRRPASAAALILSLAWTLVSIVEIWFRSSHRDLFVITGGKFEKVYATLQYSTVGIVAFLALAILVERVWPPRPVAGT